MTWWALGLFETVARVFLDDHESIPQLGVPRAREPGLLAHQIFPNTRFVKATSEDIHSWLEIPRSRLHLPPRHRSAADADATAESCIEPARDFVGSLAQAIEAYLPEGAPSIHVASEILDMSVRTLQRRCLKVLASLNSTKSERGPRRGELVPRAEAARTCQQAESNPLRREDTSDSVTALFDVTLHARQTPTRELTQFSWTLRA